MLRRSFARRSRASKRSYITRIGTRRSMRRRPWTTANGQASSPFSSGVPGTLRRIRRTVGREVPLLSRPSNSAAEVKYFPAAATAALVLSPWNVAVQGNANSVIVMPQMTQGTGASQRVGNRVQARRLQVRGRLEPFVMYDETSLSHPSQFLQGIEFHVVYDRCPSTEVPVPQDIFDVPTDGAMQRMDTRDRFSILYTKRSYFSLGSLVLPGTVNNTLTSTASSSSVTLIDVDIPIYRPIVYRDGANGSSYGDFREGAIILVVTGSFFSHPTQIIAVGPSFQGYARLTYTDV